MDVEKSIVIKPTPRGYGAEPKHVKPLYQSRYLASTALEDEIASASEIGVTIALNDAQRLRPKISLVLDANKSPYNPARIVDLATCAGDDPEPTYGIKAVLPPGSYNIDIKEQLRQIGRAQLKTCGAHLIHLTG